MAVNLAGIISRDDALFQILRMNLLSRNKTDGNLESALFFTWF